MVPRQSTPVTATPTMVPSPVKTPVVEAYFFFLGFPAASPIAHRVLSHRTHVGSISRRGDDEGQSEIHRQAWRDSRAVPAAQAPDASDQPTDRGPFRLYPDRGPPQRWAAGPATSQPSALLQTFQHMVTRAAVDCERGLSLLAAPVVSVFRESPRIEASGPTSRDVPVPDADGGASVTPAPKPQTNTKRPLADPKRRRGRRSFHLTALGPWPAVPRVAPDRPSHF
ncbi:hypothetical protein O9K51_03803 [Purpureocillium lavendulum]|uniref:Uncharacterized protein n=1 Tax=Purpureocillium lavendulum TaxID=1247861 RepID=A0AB34FU76_9HYPO|nr:hypothetical protein O9K51_03803 [Purpureocillium lavendulum]